jgi:hypothetical protein
MFSRGPLSQWQWLDGHLPARWCQRRFPRPDENATMGGFHELRSTLLEWLRMKPGIADMVRHVVWRGIRRQPSIPEMR